MVTRITPSSDKIYVNGTEVSTLEFEMYQNLYNLFQESPSYYITRGRKDAGKNNIIAVDIKDEVTSTDSAPMEEDDGRDYRGF